MSLYKVDFSAIHRDRKRPGHYDKRHVASVYVSDYSTSNVDYAAAALAKRPDLKSKVSWFDVSELQQKARIDWNQGRIIERFTVWNDFMGGNDDPNCRSFYS